MFCSRDMPLECACAQAVLIMLMLLQRHCLRCSPCRPESGHTQHNLRVGVVHRAAHVLGLDGALLHEHAHVVRESAVGGDDAAEMSLQALVFKKAHPARSPQSDC